MLRFILLCFSIELLNLQGFSQAYPDRHSTSFKDAWLSCEETVSPNIKRSASHWIMYDFGDQYTLQGSTIWNYNVPNETLKGVSDYVIDYSIDGENWIELGEYTLDEAPGSSIYQGTEGPDFSGVLARYVLVSVVSNYGDVDCSGFGEIRINATVATTTSTIAELDVDLSARPNPASDYTIVTISDLTSDMQYTINDMTGRLLENGKINSKTHRVDTSNLTSGTYTLTIQNSVGQKSMLINILNN